MYGVCALYSWPGKTAEKKYIFIVLLSKGRYWSSSNKGFYIHATTDYLKHEQKQQNCTVCTTTIIIILYKLIN